MENRMKEYKSKPVIIPVPYRMTSDDHKEKTWTSKNGNCQLIIEMDDQHLMNIIMMLKGVIETFNHLPRSVVSESFYRMAKDEAIVAAVAIHYIGRELTIRGIQVPEINLDRISKYINKKDFSNDGFVDNKDKPLSFLF